jgi:hypothetical protein
MKKTIADARQYKTLCNVLDSLRNEAPLENEIYRPSSPIKQDALIQARSKALLHLFLKARFGITEFNERIKTITDGPYDGGIDAFHIDKKTKRIYLLQSKFRATAGNFVSSNMSADDLLRMDVRRILKGEKRDEEGNFYNEQIKKSLQKAIQLLPDAGSYVTQVVLLGNTKNFTKSELTKLVEGYAVEQYPHERIYKELLFPVINGTYFSDPNLSIEINLANLKGDTHLDYDVKSNSLKSNIKLLFVPTREIGRILHTYKNSLLKFNPRSFLELVNNPVNVDIASCIEDENNNEFALFNNGITIISDGTSISSDTAKQGTAQIILRNPQLVNGGQTAYTLSRIYEKCLLKNDFSIFKGKEVLLRVITFVGATKMANDPARLALIGSISKASNSQTKIEESDRRSNDRVQLLLQDEFFTKYGLYYERKRGEFSDGLKSGYIETTLLVDRDRLIRVALASEYQINKARSSIRKFYDETALENVLQVENVNNYAYGYEILRLLELEKKSKPISQKDRYHTQRYGQALRYGQYSVLAACINCGIKAEKSEVQIIKSVLSQWIDFEKWAQKLKINEPYLVGNAFDFANYYKGSTINLNVQNFKFHTT